MSNDARAQKLARVRAIVTDTTNPEHWSNAWKEGATTWDAKRSQPALEELLETKQGGLPATGRAIVPGCGTGYDAWLLARCGYDVLGIDVAELAIERGNEWVTQQPEAKGKLELRVGDFWDQSLGTFDLAYDYTFSCAFEPSNRPRLAKRFAELVKPGGLLIALQFPLEDRTDGLGPPFAFTPAQYNETYGTDFEPVPVEVKASMPERADKERMSVWRRKS